MSGQLKLLFVGGLIAALPLLSSWRPQPSAASPAVRTEQDPTLGAPNAQDPVQARWNFAVLQYRTLDGKLVEIEARQLKKIWILTRPEGDVYLEILYDNADYSLVAVREMHLIRRSASASAVDVPVERRPFEQMVFPTFQ